MPLSEYPEPVVKHTGHNGARRERETERERERETDRQTDRQTETERQRQRDRERQRQRTSTIKTPSLRWILVLRG